MPGKEIPAVPEAGIIIRFLQKPRLKSQILRHLENLINATPGFYGSRYRQLTVQFDQHTALAYFLLSANPPGLPQSLRHRGDFTKRGFDDPPAFFQLRKASLQKRGEPAQTSLGIPDIPHGKGKGLFRLRECKPIRIYPQGFFRPGRFLRLRNRQVPIPFVCDLENSLRETAKRFAFRQDPGVYRTVPDHFHPAFTQRLPFRNTFPIRIPGFKKTDIAFVNKCRRFPAFRKGNSRKKPLLPPGTVKGGRLIQYMGRCPEIHTVIPHTAVVPGKDIRQAETIGPVHIIGKKLFPLFFLFLLCKLPSPALFIVRQFFPDNPGISAK